MQPIINQILFKSYSVYDLITIFIVVQFVFFLSLMIGLGIKKYFDAIREVLHSYQNEMNKKIIHKIIYEGGKDLHKLLNLESVTELRNLIADMATNLRGESFQRLKQLYQDLNLVEKDIEALMSKRTNKRMRAINRLEKLRQPIPFELHTQLLYDFDPTIRMLAMVLMIHLYKKKSTPYIISFIEEGRYQFKGHLFYLIQELGKYDRSAISFLFERINDETFEEALLISASMAPPIGFDEVIYHKLTKSSGPFVIVWALRVLDHYPSEKYFYLFKILKSHPFWAVRLQVIRSYCQTMIAIEENFLEDFLSDPNYLVRLEASKNLVLNFKQTLVFQKIQNDLNHPSNSIIRHLISLDEVKAA